MQQLWPAIQQESTERADLLTQHDALLTTPTERALAEATRAALAGMWRRRPRSLRLSAAFATKPQATALLRDRLDRST